MTLQCQGNLKSDARSHKTHLDLALRRNNGTALIQRSNVLPVGERLSFETSPALYSMVFAAPSPHSTAYVDWWSGAIFVWSPDLKRLHSIRLSIDRQTGALEGELRDGAERDLGQLLMTCKPHQDRDVPEPRF